MKIRRPKSVPPTGEPAVVVVYVTKPTPMVTLDDPSASLQEARGAFVRLRPPPDHSVEETTAWAISVRAIAKAATVLPTRRAALLPGTSTRVDMRPVGSIRDEVNELVREADDLDLFDAVEAIMSEVNRA